MKFIQRCQTLKTAQFSSLLSKNPNAFSSISLAYSKYTALI